MKYFHPFKYKIASYLYSILISLVAIPHALFFLFPLRVYRFIGHLLFFDIKMPKNGKWWFWFPILFFKILDLILFPEVGDLLFSFIKFNSRRLSKTEFTEAHKVFKSTLPYWKIKIDTFSLFAWMGAKFNGASNLGLVTFNTVNFNCKIDCKHQNSDMGWLIHELTHVLQMQKVGSSYIFYALYAQHTDGYYVGEVKNKQLNHFNFEQQAEIAKFYYYSLKVSTENKYDELSKDILVGNFI